MNPPLPFSKPSQTPSITYLHTYLLDFFPLHFEFFPTSLILISYSILNVSYLITFTEYQRTYIHTYDTYIRTVLYVCIQTPSYNGWRFGKNFGVCEILGDRVPCLYGCVVVWRDGMG